MDAWLFLLRWFHFLAGITWIGMLYYSTSCRSRSSRGRAGGATGMITGGLVSGRSGGSGGARC